MSQQPFRSFGGKCKSYIIVFLPLFSTLLKVWSKFKKSDWMPIWISNYPKQLIMTWDWSKMDYVTLLLALLDLKSILSEKIWLDREYAGSYIVVPVLGVYASFDFVLLASLIDLLKCGVDFRLDNVGLIPYLRFSIIGFFFEENKLII